MSASQRVTLYVRASIPERIRSHVYDVVDRLQVLSDQGYVAEMTVETWDARVPLQGGDDRLEARAHEAYRRFSTWADETDHSLEPYFRVRDSGRDEVLVLPIMCLAVETPGGIDAVYPCETDEAELTVLDGVDRLKTERVVTPESSAD